MIDCISFSEEKESDMHIRRNTMHLQEKLIKYLTIERIPQELIQPESSSISFY